MKKATKKAKVKAPVAEIIQQRIHEGLCLLCFALSIFLIFSLISYHHADPAWSHVSQTLRVDNLAGKAGAYIADILLYFSGYMGYLFPGMLLYGAWHLYKMRQSYAEDYHISLFALRLTGFLFLVATGAGIASLQIKSYMNLLPFSSGGVVGNSIALLLYGVFNFVGTTLILYTGFLIGVTLFTGFSWLNIADAVGRNVIALWDHIVEKVPSLSFKIRLPISTFKRKEKVAIGAPRTKRVINPETSKPQIVRVEPKIDIASTDVVQSKPDPMIEPALTQASATPKISRPKPASVRKKETVLFEPALEGTLPPLKLLDEADKSQHRGYTNHQLQEMSRQVELRLHDFGVDVKVVAVHPGPVVTRFELQLAAGTKVSKISGLAKDLARSLSMISVRVVEVIPGKSVIGLELPNLDREMVRLREILSSQRYIQTTSPLALALGKDIAGHPVVVDLAKMPHLLVAGTTGSGKSVGLNAMLLSLLYKATPKEMRLILIDPKMLELSVYDDIPHLLTPVVTDMKDASNALRWCVAEMERRYKLMASLGVRNLAGYNKKVKEAIKRNNPIADPFWNPSVSFEPESLEELPSIVVLADEFADMMMVVGKKIEELITRIAQKARAAGIHLILATQRPSVDVITGLIKANIPTRIAFQVSSKVDSRTILDQQGAEQLLGHGDMLYLPPGTSVPIRVHGAFVDDEEVHRVVHDLKRRGSPDYLEAVLEHTSAEDMGAIGTAEATESAGGEGDPLYDEAVKIVTETRKASISGIQRRLKIGYNRAANIVESMQAAGVVSAPEGNGVREVLAPPPVQ